MKQKKDRQNQTDSPKKNQQNQTDSIMLTEQQDRIVRQESMNLPTQPTWMNKYLSQDLQ